MRNDESPKYTCVCAALEASNCPCVTISMKRTETPIKSRKYSMKHAIAYVSLLTAPLWIVVGLSYIVWTLF